MVAEVEIINIFEQGDGDTIEFLESGFKVKEVKINGEVRDFGEYFEDKRIDPRFPCF